MQRRSFLKNAACVGACATLLAPAEKLFAASRARPFALTLLKMDQARGCVNAASCTPFIGEVSIRSSSPWKASTIQQFSVCAWFAADSGSSAFDFTSVGAYGASSDLRFRARAERLASLVATSLSTADARGPTSAQVLATSRDGGYLAPGAFWLVLHPAEIKVARHDQLEVLARVRLDVTEITA